MKTYVIGDIHGEYDKLEKVLELSKFDYDNDLLIGLGDIVDRGANWIKCVDILLKIKNRIDIRGNHDAVFLHYIKTGMNMFRGMYGSGITIHQYEELDFKLPYEKFFFEQIPYYVDEQKRCFVHGGFDRKYKIEDNQEDTLYWDRDLLEKSLSCSKGENLKILNDFKEVYIGHTPTITYDKRDTKPTFSGGLVWNLDTGSGKGGLLTIMNIDTKEYWQN